MLFIGKILVVEFSDREDFLYQQTLEWLSKNVCANSTILNKQSTELVVNPFTRLVKNREREMIQLTAKEFDLLYFLYSHKGQVFSKEQIYDLVWGYDYAGNTSNLSSFVCKLRKKIEPNPCKPTYIITVWGIGYKFDDKFIE